MLFNPSVPKRHIPGQVVLARHIVDAFLVKATPNNVFIINLLDICIAIQPHHFCFSYYAGLKLHHKVHYKRHEMKSNQQTDLIYV